jgi:hypothetical protein
MDVFSFFEKFPTELSVIEYFIKVRYADKKKYLSTVTSMKE